jgi:carbon-monoxide dehydrogenase large subunit
VSILGNRVLRSEDPKFLTTGGVYCDDLASEGALWATFVRSTVAHARLASVATSAAQEMTGVVGIYTGEDLDLPPLPNELPGIPETMARPLLARGTVRFVGEPIAVVLTEQRYQGEDAAEAVDVDYDPLPALVGPDAALGAEVLLFPEHGSNVAVDFRVPLPEEFFEGCVVVVRERIANCRVAPCPMEPRTSLASWGDDGRLTQWISIQAPHAFKGALASVLGLAPEQIRVIAPDVGGGFGAKVGPYPEELLLGWLARKAGRPVRWTETRSESMLALGHGRGQQQQVSIGGTRDGRVIAYRLDVVQDAGAYPALGAFLPFMTGLMASGNYDIAKVSCSSCSVVTNTTPTTAYRGAGRPEATAAIERAMDLFAAEIGADPAEVRRKNLISSDDFPHTTASGATYDTGDYVRALDLALEAAGYDELRKEQARRRAEGASKQIGIGMSTYVEITNPMAGYGEFAAVEVLAGGKARVYTGTSPHGQGHATAWAMLASEQLGIPMEDIEVVANDTDQVASGVGTFGSRSLQSGGLAVHEASMKLVDQARQLAAELLEAGVDDVVLDKVGGRFHVAGTPAVSKTWAELADETLRRGNSLLRVEHSSDPPGPTFPFGAHLAVVEVDTDTGQVRLQRLVAGGDAGGGGHPPHRVVNPLIFDGQRHGGLAQGAAQALMEEFAYDADGNPITANLADYPMISAAELPSFELVGMETPTPVNALGVKGIGEAATIGSTPAVQNAVVDALAYLGVRHVDMPASPQRIWELLASQRGNT